jgi:hypothetical protein
MLRPAAKPALRAAVATDEMSRLTRFSMHPLLAVFLKLTIAVTLAIVALVIVAFLLKIVVAAAVIAAIVIAGFFVFAFFRRRRPSLPLVR